MPVYCYQCRECEQVYEIKHRMSEDHKECIKCGSTDIFKKPALLDVKTKNNPMQRIGKIVDKYMADTKKEIRKEKQYLKNREL